jgi:hypothetical protein
LKVFTDRSLFDVEGFCNGSLCAPAGPVIIAHFYGLIEHVALLFWKQFKEIGRVG